MTMLFPFYPHRSVSRAVNVIKLSYLQFNAPLLLAAVACSYLAFASCKIPSSIIKLPPVPRIIAARSDVTKKHSVYTYIYINFTLLL